MASQHVIEMVKIGANEGDSEQPAAGTEGEEWSGEVVLVGFGT